MLLATPAANQELKVPSLVGLMSKAYFQDEFDGDQLATHWQVSNPDPEAYIVENGELLVIASAVGGLENESIPNLFRLKKELPKGDWTITIKLRVEFQTGRDWLQFGLYSNHTQFVVTSLFGYAACCPASSLTLRTKKRSGDKVVQFENNVWSNTLDFQQFADTVPQPITMKMIKKGRVYRSAIHFEGQKTESGEPVWTETDRVSVLRPPSEFVLNVSQWEEVNGESLFLIDSVTIETLEQ